MLPEICGVCHRTSGVLKTDVDTVHNGRGVFARKTLEIQAIQEIDQYTGNEIITLGLNLQVDCIFNYVLHFSDQF